jgi:hypothetical protein
VVEEVVVVAHFAFPNPGPALSDQVPSSLLEHSSPPKPYVLALLLVGGPHHTPAFSLYHLANAPNFPLFSICGFISVSVLDATTTNQLLLLELQ